MPRKIHSGGFLFLGQQFPHAKLRQIGVLRSRAFHLCRRKHIHLPGDVTAPVRLCLVNQRFINRQQAATVNAEIVKGTCLDERLHLPFVEVIRRHPGQEIVKGSKRTVLSAIPHNCLQKQSPHVFQGEKPETDVIAADVKIHLGFIDVRRENPHAALADFRNIGSDFRQVAKLGCQQCRKILFGIVLFEIGCAITEDRIRRRVAFVECVIGKTRKLFKQFPGNSGINAVCGATGKKCFPLRGKCRRLFLCHGATYQIRMPESISRQFAEDLHHLLLIHHTAARGTQNRLQLRDFIGDLFRMLAVFDKFRNGFHGAGTIQRNRGNNIVKAVRHQIHQGLPHPAGFQLEHAGCCPLGDQAIRVLVVQRNLFNIKFRVRLLNLHFRIPDDGEIPQAEKIEFQQPQVCHGVHIVLSNHHAVALRERQIVGQRIFGNHNACRVDRHIPRHPFKCHGKIHQPLHPGVTLIKVFQVGQLQRAGNRNAQLARDRFCNGVYLLIRHPQHAPHIPDGGSGGKRVEGDDL